MAEIVNLEECVDYVVTVVRRNDKALYGRIRNSPRDPDDDRPFILDLGMGGVRYNKWGRATGAVANELDIVRIQKIEKENKMTLYLARKWDVAQYIRSKGE